MAELSIRAKELRAGDHLLGSRQTVLSAEWRPGYRAVHLTLETRKGTVRSTSFNATTTLTIDRKD